MRIQCLSLLLLGFFTVAAAADTDLTITKSVTSNPIVSAGQNVQFTLSAQNKGPDPVASMSITDVIPAGSTFIGVDTAFSGGWTCSGTTTVTCTSPGSVPAGGGTLLYITMTAPATPGPFTNTASVSSPTPELNPTDNTASATATVVAPGSTADLALAKLGPLQPVPTGSNIDYTLIVVNNGPSTEPAPVVTDALPPGATLVEVRPIEDSVSCTGTTTIVCTFGPLTTTNAAKVSLIVKAPATPASYTNSASVTGTLFDPNLSNNAASSTTNVVSGTFSNDLSITKTRLTPASNDIQPGGTVEYLIVVTNTGPDPVSSFTVTDAIPTQATYTGYDTILQGVSCTGTTTVVCTCPQLTAGNSLGFVIFIRAPQLGGAFTNTATVTPGGGSDSNATNNTSAVTLNVIAAPVIPALSLSGLVLLTLLCAALGAIALRR